MLRMAKLNMDMADSDQNKYNNSQRNTEAFNNFRINTILKGKTL